MKEQCVTILGQYINELNQFSFGLGFIVKWAGGKGRDSDR